MNLPKHSILHAASLAALTLPVSAVVAIDWVTIGDAGNASQSAANRTPHPFSGGDGYGAVSYSYQISRNETTIAQYAVFLNAVATTDPYGLYNTSMGSDANIAGIQRSGSDGNYVYSVIGGGNRPITYVNRFDAARFANWLHNGQQTGSGAALTAEDGAYALYGAISGSLTKNVGATVWIPSENEWFKAAYYDPTHMSGVGGYWLYANRSDTMTSNNFATPGAANYRDLDNLAKDENGLPTVLSDVGAYGADSQSFYGINDMAGNVREWNADAVRGGSWGDTQFGYFPLSSSERMYDASNSEYSNMGFRLAAIPEPTTGLLTVLGLFPLLSRRRRA
jgi:formylglycine-generating enzyme required for sulfatase activity